MSETSIFRNLDYLAIFLILVFIVSLCIQIVYIVAPLGIKRIMERLDYNDGLIICYKKRSISSVMAFVAICFTAFFQWKVI